MKWRTRPNHFPPRQRGRPMSPRLLPLVFAACLLGATPVQADEFYFVAIFGSESVPKQVRYTHSWATFIKLSGCGSDLNTYRMEAFTISWMPATLEIRPLAPLPEKGVNLDLH